jgi:hypothetical protein
VIEVPWAGIRQRFAGILIDRVRVYEITGEDSRLPPSGAQPRVVGSLHIDRLSQRFVRCIRGPPGFSRRVKQPDTLQSRHLAVGDVPMLDIAPEQAINHPPKAMAVSVGALTALNLTADGGRPAHSPTTTW